MDDVLRAAIALQRQDPKCCWITACGYLHCLYFSQMGLLCSRNGAEIESDQELPLELDVFATNPQCGLRSVTNEKRKGEGLKMEHLSVKWASLFM